MAGYFLDSRHIYRLPYSELPRVIFREPVTAFHFLEIGCSKSMRGKFAGGSRGAIMQDILGNSVGLDLGQKGSELNP